MERLEDYGTVDCWFRSLYLRVCAHPCTNAGEERNVHRSRKIPSGQGRPRSSLLVGGKQALTLDSVSAYEGAVCATCGRLLFLYVKILL